ncbi:inositol monophosphatase [Haladaptatus sp. W1]|uniref:inositol monophosphatase family protein n=1 Tax=Haladaptatus sp. W1 TaxID=1897478 RepID=UPI0008497AF4|nr:inositol monophosphatase [Haladaptatus sp. W1]ODR82227.1 inositol monophosphatase [Haladaptatus sp. W1]
MTNVESRLELAERAATAGSEIAADGFRSGLAVETKSNKTDVVTEADRNSQRRVIEVIRNEFPEDAIVGEEEDALKEVPTEGDVWVIDPIDGTNNFVRGIPLWTTSVAAVRDGEAVAAANVCPALDDVYTADADGAYLNGERITVSDRTDPETFTVCPTVWWDFDRREEYAATAEGIVKRFGDMRRFGCAQIVLGMVASGALDGTVTNIVPNPWDTVAGAFMVRQAGGTVTDIHGEPWTTESRGLVASNGEVHEEVLAAARDAEPYYGN